MSTTWALWFASISLVLSLVSFGWQIVTWRLGRPFVKVAATDVRVASSPEEFVSIRSQNAGGMPVTVNAIGFASHRWRWWHRWRFPREGAGFVIVPSPDGTQLTHRLEPGAEGVFLLSRRSVVEGLDKADLTSARPWVSLATGKTLYGKPYPGRNADKSLTNR